LVIDPHLSAQILAQTPDAIIFADGDGVIRLWNHGAEVLFGFPAAEVVGCSLDLIIPERFRQAHWDGFRRAVASGRTRAGDSVRTTRAAHKFGQKLYVDLSFGVVKDDSGAVIGALAIGRDCSARFLADQALRERLAELQRPAS
jgi:PAS domain S-box-containing protein